jgi:diguanylate cyclase
LAGEIILIVDDEEQVREPIAIYLQEEGYRTVIANDGAEAMAAVSQQRPDLVLADVYMPKMNGLELAQRLRSDPLTATIPIMMLSALGDSKFVRAGYSNGADEYMTKPIELAVLLAKVQSLLNRRLGSPAGTSPPAGKDGRLRARERRRRHDDAYRLITDRLTDALISGSDQGPESGDDASDVILALPRTPTTPP